MCKHLKSLTWVQRNNITLNIAFARVRHGHERGWGGGSAVYNFRTMLVGYACLGLETLIA